MRPIPSSPSSYDGSLDGLYEEHLAAVLPLPEAVFRLHKFLKQYVSGPNPILLLRNRGVDRRGETYGLSDGTRIRSTDNSPAWWMHHLTFQGADFGSAGEFAREVEAVPCHIFENAKAGTRGINRAGWYVAHLLRALPPGGRNVAMTRATATQLFIRNVHPMNHFYLPDRPRGAARRYEGRPDVLSYMALRLAERYGGLWDEFIDMAGGRSEIAALPNPNGAISYTIETAEDNGIGQREFTGVLVEGREVKLRYSKNRLWFMADAIEPLGWADAFQVDTPDGSFVFTKREFYDTFSNVIASHSYRVDRRYHMKTPPRKAMRFMVLADPK